MRLCVRVFVCRYSGSHDVRINTATFNKKTNRPHRTCHRKFYKPLVATRIAMDSTGKHFTLGIWGNCISSHPPDFLLLVVTRFERPRSCSFDCITWNPPQCSNYFKLWTEKEDERRSLCYLVSSFSFWPVVTLWFSTRTLNINHYSLWKLRFCIVEARQKP